MWPYSNFYGFNKDHNGKNYAMSGGKVLRSLEEK